MRSGRTPTLSRHAAATDRFAGMRRIVGDADMTWERPFAMMLLVNNAHRAFSLQVD